MIKMHRCVYHECGRLHRQINYRISDFLISHYLPNSLFSSSNFPAILVSTRASKVFIAFSMKALEPCSLLSSIFSKVVSDDLMAFLVRIKSCHMAEVVWQRNRAPTQPTASTATMVLGINHSLSMQLFFNLHRNPNIWPIVSWFITTRIGHSASESVMKTTTANVTHNSSRRRSLRDDHMSNRTCWDVLQKRKCGIIRGQR